MPDFRAEWLCSRRRRILRRPRPRVVGSAFARAGFCSIPAPDELLTSSHPPRFQIDREPPSVIARMPGVRANRNRSVESRDGTASHLRVRFKHPRMTVFRVGFADCGPRVCSHLEERLPKPPVIHRSAPGVPDRSRFCKSGAVRRGNSFCKGQNESDTIASLDRAVAERPIRPPSLSRPIQLDSARMSVTSRISLTNAKLSYSITPRHAQAGHFQAVALAGGTHDARIDGYQPSTRGKGCRAAREEEHQSPRRPNLAVMPRREIQ